MDIKEYIDTLISKLKTNISTTFYNKNEIDSRLENIEVDTSNLLDKSTYDSDNDGIVDESKVAQTLEIVKSMSPLHVIGTDENGNLASLPMSLKDMQYESKNRQLDYGLFGIGTDSKYVVPANTFIKFDIKINSNLEQIDSFIQLKPNRTYKILSALSCSIVTNIGICDSNDTVYGSKGLSYDGTYNQPTISAIITTNNDGLKIGIKALDNKEISLEGKNCYLLIEEIGYARDESLTQITKLNVKSNEPISVNSEVDLTDGKVIESCFKFVEGEQNIVRILKTFDNTQSESFYYDKDKIDFSDGMSIKKAYEINSKITAENYYETDIINKDDLFALTNIEEGGIV